MCKSVGNYVDGMFDTVEAPNPHANVLYVTGLCQPEGESEPEPYVSLPALLMAMLENAESSADSIEAQGTPATDLQAGFMFGVTTAVEYVANMLNGADERWATNLANDAVVEAFGALMEDDSVLREAFKSE